MAKWCFILQWRFPNSVSPLLLGASVVRKMKTKSRGKGKMFKKEKVVILSLEDGVHLCFSSVFPYHQCTMRLLCAFPFSKLLGLSCCFKILMWCFFGIDCGVDLRQEYSAWFLATGVAGRIISSHYCVFKLIPAVSVLCMSMAGAHGVIVMGLSFLTEESWASSAVFCTPVEEHGVPLAVVRKGCLRRRFAQYLAVLCKQRVLLSIHTGTNPAFLKVISVSVSF